MVKTTLENNKIKSPTLTGIVVKIEFPSSDRYWADTLEHLGQTTLLKKRIMAPVEFASVAENCHPYAYSFFSKAQDYDTVILHKGLLGEISESFISTVAEHFHYSYGNPVFLVYTHQKMPCKSGNEHKSPLQSFMEKIHKKDIEARLFFQKGRQGRSGEKQRSPRFLILSANKMGNIGDDLVTLASRDQVLCAYPDAEVRITSPPLYRDSIKWCDCLLLGGGGLLYDRCMKNCLNYCTPLLIANELGKKTACLGQGWQGIVTQLGQRVFKESLSSCEFVSVRNLKDQEALQEIDLNTQIITTSDMAFHYFDPERVSIPQRIEKRVIITLISPRFIPKIVKEEYIEVMDKVIRYLKEEYDPIFIKHSPDDIEFYSKYSKELDIPLLTFDWEKTLEVEKEYRKAECVVTGRFHSLILSVLTNTPTMPLCCKGSKIWNGIKNSIPSLQSNLLRVKPPFSFENFYSIFNFVYSQKKCADRTEILQLFHTAQKNIELLKTLF